MGAHQLVYSHAKVFMPGPASNTSQALRHHMPCGITCLIWGEQWTEIQTLLFCNFSAFLVRCVLAQGTRQCGVH